MKTLYLLRHAKSSWKDTDLPDRDRPLKKIGRKAAAKIGQHLVKKGLLPDLVLSSTAVRSRETAEILVKEAGYAGEVVYMDDLYMAEPPRIVNAVIEHGGDHDTVMVIGHNPGLECALQNMVHDVTSLATGSLAQVQFDMESWKRLATASGRLISLWRPKTED